MNFANVKGITIPEGTVKALSIDGVKVWEKIQAAVSETLGKVWTQSNITSSCYFVSFAYHNGLWVGASYNLNNSGLYYSEDGGKIWTQCNASKANAVAYANGIWVAYCIDGLWYSADGKNWTQSNVTSGAAYNPSGAPRCLTYANGLWVAAISDGAYYSTNGKTWTKSNLEYDCKSPTYGGGLWVMGTASNGLFYSADGKNWTQSDLNAGYFPDADYGDGLWVAVGKTGGVPGAYYSEDGKNWTQSVAYRCLGITYANGLWVLVTDSVDGSGILYSEDGKNWAQSNIAYGVLIGAVCVQGLWVVAYSNYNGILYSVDGKTWTKSDNTNAALNAIAYANGVMVAGGRSGIWYSA